MTRFEPQQAADDRLAETLGAATEQLRTALEREAIEILRKAQEEAASVREVAGREAAAIEQAAKSRAAETEREALQRAQEADARAAAANGRAEELSAKADEEAARAERARASHTDRIARALADLDAMEKRMQEAVANLRRRLSGELDELRPSTPPSTPPSPEPQTEPPAVVAAEDDAPAQPDAGNAMTFSRPVPLSVATQVDSATEPNPVLDDMMRAQILNMIETGASRGEVEQFLARFKLGENYLGMLDGIYAEHAEKHGAPAPQGKRRRFRRRGT